MIGPYPDCYGMRNASGTPWRRRHGDLVPRQESAKATGIAPTPLIHVNLHDGVACHFRGIA
jgi:hypothetical protein